MEVLRERKRTHEILDTFDSVKDSLEKDPSTNLWLSF